VAARGAVDPTALVFRVRGPKVLLDLPRALRLLLRGKINPIKTLFKRRSPAGVAAARLLNGERR
jgi:hypothetical protein